jgi:hypothetical protein
MRSVTVRISAAEFSATMTEIGEWLDTNRHKPTRYKYDHTDDAVLVTVDFPAEVAATAFATRFDGVYYSSPQPVSADPPQWLLGVRRHPGIPPALLARKAPSDGRFRGIGARGAVWRARDCLALASSARPAALTGGDLCYHGGSRRPASHASI